MNENETEADASDESSDRRMDSELKIMAAILRQLYSVDTEARRRIIIYLSDRFYPGGVQ